MAAGTSWNSDKVSDKDQAESEIVPIRPHLVEQITTRTRRAWKPDSRGYYTRQIGWVTSKMGKLQQHKFVLGTDKKQAEKRERKLRELWEQFEQASPEKRPLWPENLLHIGKQISKGNSAVVVPRKPRETQMAYATTRGRRNDERKSCRLPSQLEKYKP